MSLTAQDVLDQLDDDARGTAGRFPDFDHGYNYHIDQRLSAYGGDGRRWVIVIEQLTFNPRAAGTIIWLSFHGNAITLPPQAGMGEMPVLLIFPMDDEPTGPLFTDASGEIVKLSATEVRVRGKVVPIRTDENYYWARRIESERITKQDVENMIDAAKNHFEGEMLETRLREIEEEERPRVGKFELHTWNLLRGMVPEHRELLLATEEERRRGVPEDLRLLIQIDEWDHPRLIDGELPRSSEAFKSIAKVLATGDPKAFQPASEPNTHWSNWPLSGSL